MILWLCGLYVATRAGLSILETGQFNSIQFNSICISLLTMDTEASWRVGYWGYHQTADTEAVYYTASRRIKRMSPLTLTGVSGQTYPSSSGSSANILWQVGVKWCRTQIKEQITQLLVLINRREMLFHAAYHNCMPWHLGQDKTLDPFFCTCLTFPVYNVYWLNNLFLYCIQLIIGQKGFAKSLFSVFIYVLHSPIFF